MGTTAEEEVDRLYETMNRSTFELDDEYTYKYRRIIHEWAKRDTTQYDQIKTAFDAKWQTLCKNPTQKNEDKKRLIRCYPLICSEHYSGLPVSTITSLSYNDGKRAIPVKLGIRYTPMLCEILGSESTTIYPRWIRDIVYSTPNHTHDDALWRDSLLKLSKTDDTANADAKLSMLMYYGTCIYPGPK